MELVEAREMVPVVEAVSRAIVPTFPLEEDEEDFIMVVSFVINQ
jgi:hypothetical protein